LENEIKNLQSQIKHLNELATVAYQSKNFPLEEAYDTQAKPLIQRLRELTWVKCIKCGELEPKENIDEKGLCYTDSDKSVHPTHYYWGSKSPNPLDRCSKCGVKYSHTRAHYPCPNQ